MIPGFHCSSLEFHDPATVIPKLAELGFRAIAIRPRRGSWDASADWFDKATADIGAVAKEHSIAVIVDLDAPYYDDPDNIESFSLASEDAQQRASAAETIRKWIERTAELCPLAITFSTGRVRPSNHPTAKHSVHPASAAVAEELLERIVAGIEPVARCAADHNVNLALRPVSEHAIATVAHFERFGQWLGTEIELGLAADVGEMLLGGEFPIGQRLARLGHRLSCVYLCEPDLDRGCDQRFGCGDIDLARVWNVMTRSGFAGPGVFRACGHGRLGFELAEEAISLAAVDS